MIGRLVSPVWQIPPPYHLHPTLSFAWKVGTAIILLYTTQLRLRPHHLKMSMDFNSHLTTDSLEGVHRPIQQYKIAWLI